MQTEELLDVAEACRFLGGSRPIHFTTLYRGIKAGHYSKPIKIGPFLVRWRRSELQADIDRMIAERDGIIERESKSENAAA
jgi:predicted DNA-binding transcriptional regulator AlpA